MMCVTSLGFFVMAVVVGFDARQSRIAFAGVKGLSRRDLVQLLLDCREAAPVVMPMPDASKLDRSVLEQIRRDNLGASILVHELGLLASHQSCYRFKQPQRLPAILIGGAGVPLPDGFFFNGSDFVNMDGEISYWHPLMPQFIQQHVEKLSDELRFKNQSAIEQLDAWKKQEESAWKEATLPS